MRIKVSVTLLLLTFYVVALFYACKKTKNTDEACSYATDIKPLIARTCAHTGCHGAGSTVADFTQYAELKKRADNGRIRTNVFELAIMPPPGQEPLTTQDKENLKCWLDNGAPNN